MKNDSTGLTAPGKALFARKEKMILRRRTHHIPHTIAKSKVEQLPDVHMGSAMIDEVIDSRRGTVADPRQYSNTYLTNTTTSSMGGDPRTVMASTKEEFSDSHLL